MDINNAEKWDKVAVDYQRTYNLGLNEYNSELLSFWQENRMIFPGCRAVDIGCGVGKYGTYLAALGCDVTLTDISPKMIRLAEENMSPFNTPWNTFVCDFDKASGNEEAFSQGFDFAISTMSPAINDTQTVKRMSEMTRGWCFLARFSSWDQPNRDILFDRLGVEPKHETGDLDKDCETMIQAVSSAGFTPRVKYVDYNWCDSRTVDDAVDYIQRRYLADTDCNADYALLRTEVERLCNSDGLFEDAVNTKVAWIYWNT